MSKARAIWISLSNLAFIGVTVRHLAQERSLYTLLEVRMPWKSIMLPALIIAILVAGVALELLGSKIAAWVNVGFFVMTDIYAADVLVHGWGQAEVQIFGWLLAVPASVVLVVDLLFYSAKRTPGRAELD